MNSFCGKRNFFAMDFQSSNDKLNTGLVEEGARNKEKHALVHAPATCWSQDGLQEHQNAHLVSEQSVLHWLMSQHGRLWLFLNR